MSNEIDPPIKNSPTQENLITAKSAGSYITKTWDILNVSNSQIDVSTMHLVELENYGSRSLEVKQDEDAIELTLISLQNEEQGSSYILKFKKAKTDNSGEDVNTFPQAISIKTPNRELLITNPTNEYELINELSGKINPHDAANLKLIYEIFLAESARSKITWMKSVIENYPYLVQITSKINHHEQTGYIIQLGLEEFLVNKSEERGIIKLTLTPNGSDDSQINLLHTTEEDTQIWAKAPSSFYSICTTHINGMEIVDNNELERIREIAKILSEKYDEAKRTDLPIRLRWSNI